MIVLFGVAGLYLDSLTVLVVVLGAVMIGVRSFWSDHECDFCFDLFFLEAISRVCFSTNRELAKVVEAEEYAGLVNPSILEENWFSSKPICGPISIPKFHLLLLQCFF